MVTFKAAKALTVKSAAIPQLVGQDALVPLKLSGTEGINQLSSYTLTLQTPDGTRFLPKAQELSLDDMVGREITCFIELEGMGQFVPGRPGNSGAANQGAGVREISGLITEARYVAHADRHALYELTIECWLSQLQLRSDCRVFQNVTAVQVIESILGEYPFSAEKRLTEKYPERDYCVMYNETHFEFVSRLFQENGISWFFEHTGGVHRLIYTDHNGAYRPIQHGQKDSPYHKIPWYPPGHRIDREFIEQFSAVKRITSGAYTARDYDYTRPTATLEVTNTDPRPTGHAKLERYQWRGNQPGLVGADYSQPNAGSNNAANQTEPQGRQYALQRMQLLRQRGNRAQGMGHIRGIVPGCTFYLTDHPSTPLNIEYIVLSTHFEIENVAYKTRSNNVNTPGAAGEAAFAVLGDAQRLSGEWRVTTRFEVQPSTEILRPEFTVRKPVVGGMETALVCGPDRETADVNTWVDPLGRIRVQFFWDRYGGKNHNSSCWVRVASTWAGNQLGSISIPRIGQEILVGFLGGDPDLPIVTGSVYNRDNTPPWSLPSQQALSGIRSRELNPGGGGNSSAGRSNALILDDTLKQIQVQVKSDHQHSQLSLGHITRIDGNPGRTDYRGEGFELRTDAHGVVRSNGLLLTTELRSRAAQHTTDMGETAARLQEGWNNHKALFELANTNQAQDSGDQDVVLEALKSQNQEITGGSGARGSDGFAELSTAQLVLASPAGIASTTAKNTHLQSGQHMGLTSGLHTSIGAGKSFLVSAGQSIRLFAMNAGMRFVAAVGDIDIKALKDSINLLAKLNITQTADTITITAKTALKLNGAGSYLTLDGGGIDGGSNGNFTMHSAKASFVGPASQAASFPTTSPKPGNLDLFANFAAGNPIKELEYKVTDALGTVHTGNLDNSGKFSLGGIPVGPATVEFGKDPRNPWDNASYHGKVTWPPEGTVTDNTINQPTAQSPLEGAAAMAGAGNMLGSATNALATAARANLPANLQKGLQMAQQAQQTIQQVRSIAQNPAGAAMAALPGVTGMTALPGTSGVPKFV